MLIAIWQHLKTANTQAATALIATAMVSGLLSYHFGRLLFAILYGGSFLLFMAGVCLFFLHHLYWSIAIAWFLYLTALILTPVWRQAWLFMKDYRELKHPERSGQ